MRSALLLACVCALGCAPPKTSTPPGADAVFERTTIRVWRGERLVAEGRAPTLELERGSRAFIAHRAHVTLRAQAPAVLEATELRGEGDRLTGRELTLTRASDGLVARAPTAALTLSTSTLEAEQGATLHRPAPQPLDVTATHARWHDKSGELELQGAVTSGVVAR